MLNLDSDKHCPICNCMMLESGQKYSLDQLLGMWSQVVFSEKTINEHKKQSEVTQLYFCNECQFGIYFPQIIGTSSFFVDLLKHETTYFYSDEKWDFDEAIKDVSGCNSIIEIGCGPGNFLEKVKAFVTEVCGTEYNDEALRVARSKGFTIYGMDDNLIHEKKGQFDAAFSFHVLEHVDDPVGFVMEMLTWVKPGGKVGISVPNMDGPVKYINPCISNMPPHHATHWQIKTFEKLAQKLGVRIERVAIEPLALKDRSYYSEYWPKSTFNRNFIGIKIIQGVIKIVLIGISKILEVFGVRTIPFLKGQSIYVLFVK